MDDYIKRSNVVNSLDALCDRVCQYTKAQRKVMCGACPLGDAFTVIEDDIPAADVRENVYADCIKLHDDPYIIWKCGNCGWLRERTSKPKFCEECGAEFLPAVRCETDGKS